MGVKFEDIIAENEIKARELFIANISHEMRTPLNAIFGFIHLLNKMEHPKKVEKYLATILSSSEMLLNIINDILSKKKHK